MSDISADSPTRNTAPTSLIDAFVSRPTFDVPFPLWGLSTLSEDDDSALTDAILSKEEWRVFAEDCIEKGYRNMLKERKEDLSLMSDEIFKQGCASFINLELLLSDLHQVIPGIKIGRMQDIPDSMISQKFAEMQGASGPTNFASDVPTINLQVCRSTATSNRSGEPDNRFVIRVPANNDGISLSSGDVARLQWLTFKTSRLLEEQYESERGNFEHTLSVSTPIGLTSHLQQDRRDAFIRSSLNAAFRVNAGELRDYRVGRIESLSLPADEFDLLYSNPVRLTEEDAASLKGDYTTDFLEYLGTLRMNMAVDDYIKDPEGRGLQKEDAADDTPDTTTNGWKV